MREAGNRDAMMRRIREAAISWAILVVVAAAQIIVGYGVWLACGEFCAR